MRVWRFESPTVVILIVGKSPSSVSVGFYKSRLRESKGFIIWLEKEVEQPAVIVLLDKMSICSVSHQMVSSPYHSTLLQQSSYLHVSMFKQEIWRSRWSLIFIEVLFFQVLGPVSILLRWVSEIKQNCIFHVYLV